MALKTPLYDLSQYLNVYQPSEDTFLFLDGLELDMNTIIKIVPNVIVEIGSGSGVLISSLASVLNKNAVYIATDINYEACLATTHTAALNNVMVESCCMNLLNGFKQSVFDVILFNPPYVVTESAEISGKGLSRAWAGGPQGRKIIDEFLFKLPFLLSTKGICYLLIIKENKPEEVRDILQGLGFKTVILIERKIQGENLLILKIYR